MVDASVIFNYIAMLFGSADAWRLSEDNKTYFKRWNIKRDTHVGMRLTWEKIAGKSYFWEKILYYR